MSGWDTGTIKKPPRSKKVSQQGAASGVKKHGRVWTPAMRAAAAKRAKAR